MAGEGFRVAPETLTTHAGRVQQVAESVSTAKGAGNAVQMGYGAYGQLCTIVPMIIGVLQSVILAGFDDAVQSLKHTGEQLKVTADEYRQADESIQRDQDRHRSVLRGPS